MVPFFGGGGSFEGFWCFCDGPVKFWFVSKVSFGLGGSGRWSREEMEREGKGRHEEVGDARKGGIMPPEICLFKMSKAEALPGSRHLEQLTMLRPTILEPILSYTSPSSTKDTRGI